MSARLRITLFVKPLLCLVVVLASWALLTATASADSITVEVAQDTWINSGSTNNWGSYAYVKVGSDDFSGNLRGLFKFNLPNLPPNAFIESAVFQIYYQYPNAGASENLNVSLHRLTKDWQENTVNWSLAGNSSDAYVYDTQVIGYQSSAQSKWISWNATALARQWYAGVYPNYGLALHGRDGPPEEYRYLSTREKGAGWGAKLIITWSTPLATPSPTATRTPTRTPTPAPKPENSIVDVSQDTWINSASTNTWGSYSYTKVGSDDFSGNLRTLLQFQLPTIPPAASLQSATLQVYYQMTGVSSTGNMDVSVHRLTKSWEESTANWSRMGNASDGQVYDTQALGSGYGDTRKLVLWNVTELVRGWYAGSYPNYGLALHGKEGPPEDYRYFTSKELGAGWGARLVIAWQLPSPTPTATSTSTSTPSSTPIPTHTVTATPTPTETPGILRVYLPLIVRQ